MKHLQNSFFDQTGHLNLHGRVLFIERNMGNAFDTLPAAIANHVDACLKCRGELLELYDEIDSNTYQSMEAVEGLVIKLIPDEAAHQPIMDSLRNHIWAEAEIDATLQQAVATTKKQSNSKFTQFLQNKGGTIKGMVAQSQYGKAAASLVAAIVVAYEKYLS